MSCLYAGHTVAAKTAQPIEVPFYGGGEEGQTRVLDESKYGQHHLANTTELSGRRYRYGLKAQISGMSQ